MRPQHHNVANSKYSSPGLSHPIDYQQLAHQIQPKMRPHQSHFKASRYPSQAPALSALSTTHMLTESNLAPSPAKISYPFSPTGHSSQGCHHQLADDPYQVFFQQASQYGLPQANTNKKTVSKTSSHAQEFRKKRNSLSQTFTKQVASEEIKRSR